MRTAFVVALIAYTSVAHAWDGSQTLEPGLSEEGLLLFEDFEQADFGDRWQVYWDAPPGPDTVDDPAYAGARALVIDGIAGEHDSVGGGEYAPAGDGFTVASMRLALYLPEDFTLGPCNQLKLFAIKGGASMDEGYGGAGEVPDGYGRMSVVLAVDNDMALHFYTYHMDQQDEYGDYFYLDVGGQAYLEPGRWTELELMIQLNTPGEADGVVRGWVDGELRGEHGGLRFRETDAVRIRRFDIEHYWGGSGDENTSPVDQPMFVDNVVIATTAIGVAPVDPVDDPVDDPTGDEPTDPGDDDEDADPVEGGDESPDADPRPSADDDPSSEIDDPALGDDALPGSRSGLRAGGCSVGGSGDTPALGWFAALALLALRRRRDR